ncbi:MAG TPA: PIG-L deacetylase family protein [Nitrososphaera sp.]|nr:PIG-L deacetylase family protein [Nitrososphaera sp.]
MNILAIGAHPDDIELGCGGLLIKAARQGHGVFMYTLTRGAASGDPQQRAKELMQSAKFIGAKALWIDNFEDTKLNVNTSELINHIEFFINKADPDIILTHSLEDYHHDHRAIAASTLEAGRFIPNIMSYEIPLTKDFKPQVFYDISDVVDDKVELIKIFWSQQTKLYLKANAIKGLAEYRALQSRLNTSINHVEAFEVLKMCFGKEFKLWKVPNDRMPRAVKAKPSEIIELFT